MYVDIKVLLLVVHGTKLLYTGTWYSKFFKQ